MWKKNFLLKLFHWILVSYKSDDLKLKPGNTDIFPRSSQKVPPPPEPRSLSEVPVFQKEIIYIKYTDIYSQAKVFIAFFENNIHYAWQFYNSRLSNLRFKQRTFREYGHFCGWGGNIQKLGSSSDESPPSSSSSGDLWVEKMLIF